MTQPRQAIPRMAEALDVSRAFSENCLEEAQKNGLIRTGRRGGGKGGVEMTPTEATNFYLGAAAEPRNEMGRLVPAWRALVPVDHPRWMTTPSLPEKESLLRGCCFGMASIELDTYRDAVDKLPKVRTEAGWSGNGDERCYRVLPGASLGEVLDPFGDYLSYPAATSLRMSLRNRGTLSLHMYYDGTARVSLQDHDRELVFNTFYRPKGFKFSKRPGLSRNVTISFKVFEAAADLWADSRARLGVNKFPVSPGGEGSPSRNESAEAHPCKDGTSAFVTDRQSIEGALSHTPQGKAGGRHNPIGSTCVCEKAIPSVFDGWPLSQPLLTEAPLGQRRCTHLHPRPPHAALEQLTRPGPRLAGHPRA